MRSIDQWRSTSACCMRTPPTPTPVWSSSTSIRTALSPVQWIMRLLPGHTRAIHCPSVPGGRIILLRSPLTPETTPDTQCVFIIPLASGSWPVLPSYPCSIRLPYTLAPSREDPHPWNKKKQALHKLPSQERTLSSTSGNSHPNSDYSRCFFIKTQARPTSLSLIGRGIPCTTPPSSRPHCRNSHWPQSNALKLP